MALPAKNPDLGFKPGDHVRAFCDGSGNYLDDTAVDFVAKGLRSGSKCSRSLDTPSSVQGRLIIQRPCYIPNQQFPGELP